MKHLLALVIKFAVIAVALGIVLSYLTALTTFEILAIGAILTVIAYLVGDLFILDKYNNTVATLADAALAFVILWAVPFFRAGTDLSLADAAIGAVVIAVGEWIYHKYVRSFVFPPVTTR